MVASLIAINLMLVISPALATPGAQLWVSRYNGLRNGPERATALGVSPDGSKVFVTGHSKGSRTGDDYATVAYDASTGAQLWVSRYNGPGNGTDQAIALGASPDGSLVFVTGYSDGSGTEYDYATVAYDASTGAQLWVSRYNGPGDRFDEALALGVSPDSSTVFVTGVSFARKTDDDYLTLAYDSSTGVKSWKSRYNGPANGPDGAVALGLSPDGSTVFVTGSSAVGATIVGYTTVAYDAPTGAQLWATRYHHPKFAEDLAAALGVSPDGSEVFVTGDGGVGYRTVAYDASTGAQLWTRRYKGGLPRALGVSPDGSSVFVTGWSGTGYHTVAYDASTGVQLWARRYNNDLPDYASALGVSPDSSTVFVTGTSFPSMIGPDDTTVAYDASTGAELWVTRYNGPDNGNDGATALGVSPDGSTVFVTGHSKGLGSHLDYATIAYSTA